MHVYLYNRVRPVFQWQGRNKLYVQNQNIPIPDIVRASTRNYVNLGQKIKFQMRLYGLCADSSLSGGHRSR